MTDNRIASRAAAAARLLLLTAGLFGGLTLMPSTAIAQPCLPSCPGGGGDIIPDTGDGQQDDGQTPDPDDGQTQDLDNNQGTTPDGGTTPEPTPPPPTQPTTPAAVTPPAATPIVVTASVSPPVTVSVGETFRPITVTSSSNSVIVSGGNDVVILGGSLSPETIALKAVEAILPADLKSLAPDLLEKVKNGEIRLDKLELAMQLRSILLSDDLDGIEKQTIYELLSAGFLGAGGHFEGAETLLLSVLPSGDPTVEQLKRYARYRAEAEAMGQGDALIRRAFGYRYMNKLADLAGLTDATVYAMCIGIMPSNRVEEICQ